MPLVPVLREVLFGGCNAAWPVGIYLDMCGRSLR